MVHRVIRAQGKKEQSQKLSQQMQNCISDVELMHGTPKKKTPRLCDACAPFVQSSGMLLE